MSLRVEILSADWAALVPGNGLGPDEARALLARARAIALSSPAGAVPEGLSPAERVERLRGSFAVTAARAAVHRFELVTQRERFERSERDEIATYERHLELDRDVVPPLKLEARALRAEIRRLEAEARALGIDVDAVQPAIDWRNTLAVDGYEAPRYETPESRKRAAVEFFR
ncbi:MAG TPA: hypothetical protein VFC04_01960, partial [Actinomycetota bacterium]|nr:hypothetical protein [Actinomycetota bacterium]